jgi:hypothetical protein
MKTNDLSSSFIAVLFSGLIIAISNVSSIYAQQQQIAPNSNSPFPSGPSEQLPNPFGPQRLFGRANNFTFGPIASIQNNESGHPAWLVIGHWRGNLLSFKETANTATLSTAASTQNVSNNNNNTSRLNSAIFNADMRMIMLNGSGPHTHVLTNFKLSKVSFGPNGTTTYLGNSTISMREGPVADVPTTIKVTGEIISIFPDPSKVKDHFGNTPIYGAIQQRAIEGEMRGPFPPPRGPPLP